MRMQELLEKDKEKIISQIASAPTSEEAAKAVDGEFTKILYAFNDEEESDTIKTAAYNMVQTARSSSLLLDCDGETKVWGKTAYTRNEAKKSHTFIIFALAGVFCIAGAILLFAAKEDALDTILSQTPVLVLAIAGVILMFLAGAGSKSKSKGKKEDLYGVTLPDGQKVYRAMLSTVLAIDKRLDEMRTAETIEKKKRLREDNGGFDPKQIDLLSRILEDAYTEKESVYAQEMISHIKFYLHSNMIETLDYTPENRAMFDLMPSSQRATLRPALVMDGRLLKKGLATGGQ